MSPRLHPGRPVTAEVARIAARQLDAALVVLTMPAPDPGDIARVRRRLKGLRSLMALAEQPVGLERSIAEADAYREAGRHLGARRDEAAIIEAVDRLAERFPPNSPFTAGTVLAQVRRQLLASAPPAPGTDADLRAAFAIVVTARSRVAMWGFEGDDPGWSRLAPGLRRTYRSARQSARQLAVESDEVRRHEARRLVKLFAGQLDLLRPVLDPEDADRRDRCRELARVLGHQRDLGLLSARLESFGLEAVDVLGPVISREHRRLDARIPPLVAAALGPKSSALVAGIGQRWDESACADGSRRQRS